MGQGRHTLRSISDHVYPRCNNKKLGYRRDSAPRLFLRYSRSLKVTGLAIYQSKDYVRLPVSE